MRGLVGIGGVVAALVVGLVGCTANDVDEVFVQPDENVAAAQSALSNRCRKDADESAAARQAKASKALRYVFGDDSSAPPATPACNKFKVGLDALRASIAANPDSLSRTAQTEVCGLAASVYRFGSDAETVKNVLVPAFRQTNACLGAGVDDFFLVGGDATSVEIDPEPAVLTASLGSSTGSTAPAYYKNTPTVTTSVLRFGTLYASCGVLAGYAGYPCSPIGLAAGATTSYALVKLSTACACR